MKAYRRGLALSLRFEGITERMGLSHWELREYYDKMQAGQLVEGSNAYSEAREQLLTRMREFESKKLVEGEKGL